MPRNGDEVRRRLQEVALALYAAPGFDQTTVADIAARAGVTTRTFFRHFIDKREVFFDGEEALCGMLVDGVRGAPAGLPAMEVLLRAFRFVAPLMEQHRAFSAPRHKIIEASPALRERALAKKETIMLALARALTERGVDPPLATLTAEICIAAFAYATKLWLDDATQAFETCLDRSFAHLNHIVCSRQ